MLRVEEEKNASPAMPAATRVIAVSGADSSFFKKKKGFPEEKLKRNGSASVWAGFLDQKITS
ncbi:MAG: hypothetical protein C0600_01840 [Ignavibacteria bacterium]|nr:MAG: hypothetical protein C0600_01840 [Ignavibacteria bacterium]